MQVEITIEDINDNPPVFEKRFYTMRFPSNTLKGSEVGTVLATDEDSSSVISYIFDYDRMNTTDLELKKLLLTMDSISGDISLETDLQSDQMAPLIDVWMEYFVSSMLSVFLLDAFSSFISSSSFHSLSFIQTKLVWI